MSATLTLQLHPSSQQHPGLEQHLFIWQTARRMAFQGLLQDQSIAHLLDQITPQTGQSRALAKAVLAEAVRWLTSNQATRSHWLKQADQVTQPSWWPEEMQFLSQLPQHSCTNALTYLELTHNKPLWRLYCVEDQLLLQYPLLSTQGFPHVELLPLHIKIDSLWPKDALWHWLKKESTASLQLHSQAFGATLQWETSLPATVTQQPWYQSLGRLAAFTLISLPGLSPVALAQPTENPLLPEGSKQAAPPHQVRNVVPALPQTIRKPAATRTRKVIPRRSVSKPATASHTRRQKMVYRPPLKQTIRSTPGTGSYTVQPGDTLSLIAQRILGHSARWEEIYSLNRSKLATPHQLQVGQSLRLPTPSRTSVPARRGASSTYTVQPGDTLAKIAHNSLGNAARWEAIYEHNKRVIPNPRLIYPGQKLILPIG